MLARRILRMRDDLSLEMSLSDLMNHHLDHHFGGEGMKQTRQGIITILDGEEKRYLEMLRKGEQVVKTQLKDIAADISQIPDEILFSLNDSHGLALDMAVSFAQRFGWPQARLRTGFMAEMAEWHAAQAKEAAKGGQTSAFDLSLPELPETEPLYYEDVMKDVFEASVLLRCHCPTNILWCHARHCA